MKMYSELFGPDLARTSVGKFSIYQQRIFLRFERLGPLYGTGLFLSPIPFTRMESWSTLKKKETMTKC